MTHAAAVLRRALLPAFLMAVAFALGHQITYVVEYGTNAGSALARSGHGLDWTFAVASIALLSVALAGLAVRELRRLSRQARELTNVGSRGSSLAALVADTVPLALAVFVVSLASFVVLENLEYAAAGLASPGLTLIFSPQHQATLIVFELVSLAVASVAALYRWRRDILVELIKLAHRLRLHGRAPLGSRPIELTLPASSIVRGRPPGRAPPLPA
ncbi:MAG TPA: hypothetical protein VIK00_04290 [Candidatus Limnocylindrales bacterium]